MGDTKDSGLISAGTLYKGITSRRALTCATFLTIVLLAGLARWTPARFRYDLWPWPDTVEYAVAARNFVEHGSFFVEVNGIRLPSRYPIGFPLLIVPVYWLFGTTLPNAVYVSLALSVIQIVLVFWLAKRLFGDVAGSIAAALMALSPPDLALAREIMSDPASSVFVVSTLLVLSYVDFPAEHAMAESQAGWRRHYKLLCAGGMFGFACLLRQPNVLLLPAYLMIIVLMAFRSAGRSLLGTTTTAAAMFCAGWLLFQVPLCVYNQVTFGGVLRSGYNFWIEGFNDVSLVFNIRHAFGTKQNAIHYLAILLGMPGKVIYGELLPLYSSRVFLLAVLTVGIVTNAAMRAIGGRVVHIAPWHDQQRGVGQIPLPACYAIGIVLIIAITYTQFTLFFWEASIRFVFIFAPLIAMLAGGGGAALLAQLRVLAVPWHLPPRGTHNAVVGVVFLTLFFQLGGILQASYWWRLHVQREVFPADFAVHSRYSYACIQALVENTEADAVVVSDHFSHQYFSAFLPQRRFVRFLQPDLLPRTVYAPTFAKAPAAVQSLLTAGHPVYYVGGETDFMRIPESKPFQLSEVPVREVLKSTGVWLFRISMR